MEPACLVDQPGLFELAFLLTRQRLTVFFALL